MQPATSMPTIARLVISADHRVKAQFTDNSVLLLAASGAAFVHVDGSSSCGEAPCRQLSQFAISRYVPKLAVALQFRNLHQDVPFHCSAISRAGNQRCMSLGFQISEVWWPANPEEAHACGCVDWLQDGSIALSSSDGSARIVLHPTQQRFAVCYPLLVTHNSKSGQYEYIWQTQVFSIDSFPLRWESAVSLLLQCVGYYTNHQSQQQTDTQVPYNNHVSIPAGANLLTSPRSRERCSNPPASITKAEHPTHEQSYAHSGAHSGSNTSQLVVYGAATTDVQQTQQRPCTVLPTADKQPSADACRTDSFEAGSWWFEPSLTVLPSDIPVVFEWTPDAMYEYNPTTQEAKAWIHLDDSCVVTERSGKFIRHIRSCTPGSISAASQPPDMVSKQSMYAVSSIPEFVWSSSQSSSTGIQQQIRVPLGQVASHMLKLRQQMSSIVVASNRLRAGLSSRHDDSTAAVGIDSSNGFCVISDEVLDCDNIPGQGSFTAYTDGRVRAMFTDRTIMHLSSCHTLCKVILPDGQSLIVNTNNPVGVEQYMQVLIKYCNWAFKSADEKHAALSAQSLASVQAAASQRMAQLLEFSLTGTRPADRPSQHWMPLQEYEGNNCVAKHSGSVGMPDTRRNDTHHSARQFHTPGMSNQGSSQDMHAWQPPVSMPNTVSNNMHDMVEELLQRNAALIESLR